MEDLEGNASHKDDAKTVHDLESWKTDADLSRSSMGHGQPGAPAPRSLSVYDVDDATFPLWPYCYLEINVDAI